MTMSKPASTSQRLIWLSNNCINFNLNLTGKGETAKLTAKLHGTATKRISFVPEELDSVVRVMFDEFFELHQKRLKTCLTPHPAATRPELSGSIKTATTSR